MTEEEISVTTEKNTTEKDPETNEEEPLGTFEIIHKKPKPTKFSNLKCLIILLIFLIIVLFVTIFFMIKNHLYAKMSKILRKQRFIIKALEEQLLKEKKNKKIEEIKKLDALMKLAKGKEKDKIVKDLEKCLKQLKKLKRNIYYLKSNFRYVTTKTNKKKKNILIASKSKKKRM